MSSSRLSRFPQVVVTIDFLLPTSVILLFSLCQLFLVDSHLVYEGRRLKITPKECKSSSTRYAHLDGTCMFNLECQEKSGVVIGACVDRFLFGACCHIVDSIKNEAISHKSKINVTRNEWKVEDNGPFKVEPYGEDQSLSSMIIIGKQNSTSSMLHDLKKFSQGDATSQGDTSVEHHDIMKNFHKSKPTRRPNYSYHETNPSKTESVVGEKATSNDNNGSSHTLRPHRRPLPSKELAAYKRKDEPSKVFRTSTSRPEKLSTFMYVEAEAQDDDIIETSSSTKHGENAAGNSNKTDTFIGSLYDFSLENRPQVQSLYSKVDQSEKFPNSYHEDDEEGQFDETVSGNTESVWSVMMQLAPMLKQPTLGSLNGDSISLDPLQEDQTDSSSVYDDDTESSEAWRATTMSSTSSPSISALSEIYESNMAGVDEPFVPPHESYLSELATEEALIPPTSSEKPVKLMQTSMIQSSQKVPTSTPTWASSTYAVHTFQYPDTYSDVPLKFQSLGTEPPSVIADVKPSNNVDNSTKLEDKLTTWLHYEKTKSTTPQSVMEISTFPEAKPTRPQHLLLNVQDTQVIVSKNSLGKTTVAPTTPKTTKMTSTSPSALSNHRPGGVTKLKPYTLPSWKKGVKKPSVGVKSDQIRPSTTETSTSVMLRNSVTSSTTEKPGVKDAISTKVVTMSKPNVTFPLERIKLNPPLAEDDLDSNLDSFVDQVVQGIAGGLDSLDLDDVDFPLPDKIAESDYTSIESGIFGSDPIFPPFPFPKVKGTNVKPKTKNRKNQNTLKAFPTKRPKPSSTTRRPLDYRKDCGVRSMKSGRIVGGKAAAFGRWPWQALVKESTWLGLFSKNKCGGVLISDKFVLTAAHCQPGFLASLSVVLGDFDLSRESEGSRLSVTKNVRRVIVHRDYKAATFENDIAILELDSPIDLEPHVVPICLPKEEEVNVGTKCYVTGWGRLKYGGGVPQSLHEVEVPIIRNDECQNMFQKAGHLKAIKDSFLCAGYAEGLKDSCEGDSGGPLMSKRSNGQWILAGTVSHGIKCAWPNLPGVYMRMTYYKPWIQRVTGLKN